MIRLFTQRTPGHTRSSGAFDLLIVLASFVAVHLLYLRSLDLTPDRLVVMFAAVVLMSTGLSLGGMYRQDRMRALHEELGRLFVCWMLALAAVGLFAYLSKTGESVSRGWVGGSMLLSLGVLAGARIARGVFHFSTRSAAEELHTVAIVGSGEITRLVLDRLDANPWAGYEIAAVFGDRDAPPGSLPGGRSLYGRVEDLFDFIEARRRAGDPVDEVWMTLPLSRQNTIDAIVEALGDSSVDVCLVPDTFGLRLLAGSVTSVSDLRVVNVSEIRLPPRAELFKRLFDYGVAGLAVAALALPMLLIALVIRLESRGPAIFRQARYGINGKEIEVWKFRSMRVQKNGDEVAQATRFDSRVTRVGRFLRRSSLDELPQFLNVLQGTMSIVGPRPHAVVHNEAYRRQIKGYMMRHKIKPGITGWAQVNGWRGETDTLEKMEKRVHHDLEYIRNWSPWLDVRIMLLTVTRGFSGRNVY